MSVQDAVRDEIRDVLRKRADELGWLKLPAPRKSKLYEQWTKETAIGGVLAKYLDARRVRVYIKDSLLKDYVRNSLADAALPFRALDIAVDSPIAEVFIKPHGRCLRDGRVVSWGRADDWKTVLMATYERAYPHPSRKPHGAVLMRAVGRYEQDDVRGLVENAAKLLGIERLTWVALQVGVTAFAKRAEDMQARIRDRALEFDHNLAAIVTEDTVTGQFVRDVLSADELTEDERLRVVMTGLRALDGASDLKVE